MLKPYNVSCLITVLFVVFVSLFYGISPAGAFSEEFNSGYSDLSYWESTPNLGLISFTNEEIVLTRSIDRSISFPYIHNIKDIFPASGEFTIDISFKYLNTGNYGDGIVISKSLPAINSDINAENVFFKIWQDAPLKLRVVSHVCTNINPSCDTLQPNLFFHTTNTDFNTHVIRISYSSSGVYEVFVDDLTSPLFQSAPNQERPSKILLGNSTRMNNTDYWSSFEVDYVRVTSGISGGGSGGRMPVVFLPGMGASWDYDAILNGASGSNWAIPDFVNVYDNLITSFENDGYVTDTDLFVFAYDWRRNLDTLADQLDSYLGSLVSSGKIGASDKVNLVGHSMGGLVARSYLQKHGNDKANKLVTAGSPHLGVSDTYSIWQGATVIDRPWWQKTAIELLARLNRQPGEDKVTTIRRLAPAMKDLLPTYDYLILDGVLKSWNELVQKNDYLYSIGDITLIDGITKVMVGTGVNTKQQINAVTRDYKDVMAGKWEDGKALSFVMSDGDGTVWTDSAKGIFSDQQTIGANHAEIISDGQAIVNIFSELGLDTSKVVSNTNPDTRDSVLAVVLRSPGTLEVCEGVICNSNLGLYFSGYKLFLLPGYAGQQLDIKVLENGLGDYNLHIGELSATREDWRKIGGKLKNGGQQDTYVVTNTGSQLEVSQMGETVENGLEMTAGLLELVEPGWDAENNVDTVLNGSLSILDRLTAARKIRYSLVEVIKEAHSNNEPDIIEKAFDVWLNLDKFMEDILTNDAYVSADQTNRHLQIVPYYKQSTENELISSSGSFYSGEFLGEADRQSELASVLALGQETLRLDKFHSARYLYLLSLSIGN
jgi:pimeloyl-ACP methyl ester carboxylesterase